MYIFRMTAKQLLLTGLFVVNLYPSFAQETDSTAISEEVADSLALVSSKKAAAAGPSVLVTVVDASTNKALSGVNISIPGYAAAITDEKGSARVRIPNTKAVIILTTGGYITREEYVKGRSDIKVSLQQAGGISIFGTVNTPFGAVYKSGYPFSSSGLKVSEGWTESSKETPDTYLQGKISGLSSVRRSGTPSVGANMFVRGFNSVYTTNQPLIVVDGMIFNNDEMPTLFPGFSNNSVENIDVKDIEEVVLIKDAGAAAYGTKAANGVLLITTRRAASEATRIDFGAFGGFNAPVKALPVMGASDYRRFLINQLQSANFNNIQIENQPYLSAAPNGNAEFYKYQFNTNWQKNAFASSYNQNYHLNVSGGDNIAKYNLSLGYLSNGGAIQNTNLVRYFTRFNSDFVFSKKFKATTNLAFSSSSHTIFNQGSAFNTSPIYLSLVKAPFMSPNDVGALGELSPNYAQADLFGFSNPAAVIGTMDAINNSYRVSTAASFIYQFNSKFSAQTQLGVLYDKGRDRLFSPSRGLAKDTLLTAIANNKLGSNTNRLFALFNDSRLNYSVSFSHLHKLDARVGIRYKQDKYETDRGITYNSSTDEYRSLSGGNVNLREFGGSLRNMRWMNTYANVDYSYANKYFLSLNTALDGSSRFGKTIPGVLTINGNNMAVLPSAGFAWLASSEDFLSRNSMIDLLKLRVSYGLVGNDDIGDFESRSYYVSQSFYDLEGYRRGNVGNTNLKWETVEKLNGGIDVSLFRERLNISLDAYRNYTRDMITRDRIDPVSGFDFSLSNGGEMKTTGFDLSLASKLVDRKFKWDANLTVSRYKNKVTKLNSGSIQSEFYGQTIFLTQVGSPANVFYGYSTNGVYATSDEAAASNTFVNPTQGLTFPVSGGDVRFVNYQDSEEDLALGRKLIDINDRVIIGDPNPDFTGSLGNTLAYGNWSLNALFTFSYGNDVYNWTRHQLESMSGFQNQLLSVNNRWISEGQITNTPKSVMGDPIKNARFSDRWIEDGSYLRLRTLALSYNFPVRKNNYLKTLKIYGTASNVFTLSKYLGFDPEFSATRSILGQGVDAGFEPQFTSVQIGVRVGL